MKYKHYNGVPVVEPDAGLPFNDCKPIRTDLHVSVTYWTLGLMGELIAFTVTEVDVDDLKALGEDKNNVYFLVHTVTQRGDGRNCWVCVGAMNKACLNAIP